MVNFRLVLVLLQFPVISSRESRKSKPKNTNLCDSAGYLRFDRKPPESQSLTICNTFSDRTCCNTTHTNKIRRQILGYYDDKELSVDCRTIGVELQCSMCDPRIGTRLFDGVCLDYCQKAYRSCREAFYEVSTSGRLWACLSTSLVCSTLETIVTEKLALGGKKEPFARGETFCKELGLTVSTELNCYDGSLSSPRRPPHSSTTRKGLWKEIASLLDQMWWQFQKEPAWKQCIFLLIPVMFSLLVNRCVRLCIGYTSNLCSHAFSSEQPDQYDRSGETVRYVKKSRNGMMSSKINGPGKNHLSDKDKSLALEKNEALNEGLKELDKYLADNAMDIDEPEDMGLNMNSYTE